MSRGQAEQITLNPVICTMLYIDNALYGNKKVADLALVM